MKKIISLFAVLCLVLGMVATMAVSVSAAGEISIASADDWMTYLSGKSGVSQSFVITASELDFTGKNVQPSSGFKGTINGNGAVLKNITMEGEGDVALFDDVGEDAVIENLVIKSSSFKATKNWVAPIACCSKYDITIRNIYVCEDVTVTSESDDTAYAGGIIGGVYQSGSTAANTLIENCVFAGTVICKGDYAGGIIASNYDGTTVTIRNCLNIGTVTTTENYASGIGVAYGTMTITGCVNAGVVSGKNYVAGIASGNPGGAVSVSNCYYIDEKVANCNGAKGGTVTEENNTKVELSALLGTNASVTIDGFTKRENDIMLPTALINEIGSNIPSTVDKYLAKYTVTWMNGDIVLASEEYKVGDTPEYKGETPTKAEDETYTYTFDKWSPTVTAVTGDVIYKAEFFKTRKSTGEAEDPTNEAEDDFAPVTTGQNEAEVTEAPKTEEGGCGSVIGVGAVALVAMIGASAAFVAKKKED